MNSEAIFKKIFKCVCTYLLTFGIFYFVSADARECSKWCQENDSQKIGEKLVSQFWQNVEKQDICAYSKAIACSFQGLNLAGIYDREDQIFGLSHLTVTAFELKNLVQTQEGNTLIVSYDFYALGEGIVSGPSIDVWHKTSQGWKQVSHSYVPFENFQAQ